MAKLLFFDSYVRLVIANDYKALDPNILLTYTTQKRSKLSNITNGEDKFIFRFSYMECSSFVDILFKIYSVQNEKHNLSLEQKDFPFLSVLSSNNPATKLFLPMKEYPHNMQEYVSYVSKFLSENKH